MSSTSEIDRLTPRQRDVLELLAKGLTNEDIAGVLGIAIATVKAHMTALMHALDVTNRTEAVSIYFNASARPDSVEQVLSRPAIAVLPLVPLDDAPRTRVAGLAVAHDLASLFACWCWFPVIASAASDGARALGSTQAIGRALGARFLVDGSLRLGGDKWRLVVRIDDAETGHCLWTDRYDFAASEFFAVQDDVCERVVASAYPVLMSRVQLGGPGRANEVATWELAHQGMQLVARRESGAALTAADRFSQALATDPLLVLGHYGLGLSAYDDVLNQWTSLEASRDRLITSAVRCIEIAPHIAEGYFLQARWFQTRGDHARAVPVLEMAIARNPSFAPGHALLAQALHLTGRSEDGLARMRHALRLGPRAYVAGLALLHFMRREYEAALENAETAVSFAPHYTFARVLAAASAQRIGDRARALEHARRLTTDYPPFRPGRMLATFGAEVDTVQRIGEALVSLGLDC